MQITGRVDRLAISDLRQMGSTEGSIRSDFFLGPSPLPSAGLRYLRPRLPRHDRGPLNDLAKAMGHYK